MKKDDFIKLCKSVTEKLTNLGKEKPAEDAEQTNLEAEEKPAEEAEEAEEVEVNLEEEIDDPPIEDVLNVSGLATAINLATMKDGSFYIYASVDNGQIVWGDISYTNYKRLALAKQEELDKTVTELKAQIAEKEKAIVALSTQKDGGEPNQAPTPVDGPSHVDVINKVLNS